MSAYLRKGRPSSMYSSSIVYPKLHFSELWLFHCSLTPPVFDIYLFLKLSLLGPWSCLELFRQETRVSLTHLRDAFVYRSVKVTKHSTIPYVRYSFLLCNSNFVFKTRHLYDIRLQKCRDLENRVRGPSRSLEMSPCDRVHLTSY